MTSGSSSLDRGSQPRSVNAKWASAYKIILHHARENRRRLRRSAGQGSGPNRIGPYRQRCAVRVDVHEKWHIQINATQADSIAYACGLCSNARLHRGQQK
jgi:hypothetical protein